MARYALVIGISEYKSPTLPSLSKPSGDAEAIAALLREHGDCQEVTLLNKGKVTEDALWEAFETILDKQGKGSDILIYFTGHGVVEQTRRNQQGFLASYECSITKNRVTGGISFDDLDDLIAKSEISGLVMLLDCCHSGLLLKSAKDSFKEFNQTNKDYALIAACRDFEQAAAIKKAPHSIFTGALLAGLAQENQSKNGQINSSSLFGFISDQLKQRQQESIQLDSGRAITIVNYGNQSKNIAEEHLPTKNPKEQLFITRKVLKLYIAQLKSYIQEIKLQIQEVIVNTQYRCSQILLDRHIKMHLFGGEQVNVDKIYVNINVLNKPASQHFNPPETLLDNFKKGTKRIPSISKIHPYNSGFEIVQKESRLAILGKPGSGKTTFLKSLVIKWCRKKIHSNKIAVFIESRSIQDRNWHLIQTLSKAVQLEYNETIDLVLLGKFLIFMDGLDEIPTEELRCNVREQIQDFLDNYSCENHFILTCRTQVQDSIPRDFTLVEMADFSQKQVEIFVKNWFELHGSSKLNAAKKWQLIEDAVEKQADLKELTSTPVLLNLMCVVIQDGHGQMPTEKKYLYEKGVRLLLSRWNEEKKIKGWEFGTDLYRKLSRQKKESLLTQLAAYKFENPKNFVLFEQDEIAEQITKILQLNNLEEGIAVLKAIETQHGLLVEQADELWSFSHLTFQEYFMMKCLKQLPSQELAKKILDGQWQHVVTQLVTSQQPADDLFSLIKKAIDKYVVQDKNLYTFMSWLLKKSKSVEIDCNRHYRLSAIRVFYYSLTIALASARRRSQDYFLARSKPLNIDNIFLIELVISLDSKIGIDIEKRSNKSGFEKKFNKFATQKKTYFFQKIQENCSQENFSLTLDYVLIRNLSHALAHYRKRTEALDSVADLDLAKIFKQDFTSSCDLAAKFLPDLELSLRELYGRIPSFVDSKNVQDWWTDNGQEWIGEMQNTMIKSQGIGRDWMFTDSQFQQLLDYYEANRFLLSLMDVQGAITEDCRIEIKKNLLLPITLN